MERDYYSLLCVGRDASQGEIKRAFRSRILLVHPDKNPTDRVAADRARDVIEAYRVLAQPESRHSYDRVLVAKTSRAAVCRTAGSGSSCWPTRAVVVMLFLAMSVGLIFAVAEALANRAPVFRPYVGVIDVSTLDQPVAVVAAPDVSNCAEWYAARQYQMTLASQSATRHVVEVYSEACRSAARRHDWDRARFYSRCVQMIENIGPSVTL